MKKTKLYLKALETQSTSTSGNDLGQNGYNIIDLKQHINNHKLASKYKKINFHMFTN